METPPEDAGGAQEARGFMNGRRPRTLISYQSVAAAAFYPMISPRCH